MWTTNQLTGFYLMACVNMKETMLYLQWAIGIIFEHEEVQDKRNFTIGSILPSQIYKVRYSVIIIPK